MELLRDACLRAQELSKKWVSHPWRCPRPWMRPAQPELVWGSQPMARGWNWVGFEVFSNPTMPQFYDSISSTVSHTGWAELHHGEVLGSTAAVCATPEATHSQGASPDCSFLGSYHPCKHLHEANMPSRLHHVAFPSRSPHAASPDCMCSCKQEFPEEQKNSPGSAVILQGISVGPDKPNGSRAAWLVNGRQPKQTAVAPRPQQEPLGGSLHFICSFAFRRRGEVWGWARRHVGSQANPPGPMETAYCSARCARH